MKKIRFYFKLLLLLSLQSISYAQVSSVSSGGNASGTGGKVSYSVGQVFYSQERSSSGSVDQGVQHAYEIYTLMTSELFHFNLEIFPNPSTDFLILRAPDLLDENYSFQVLDLNGKLISNESFSKTETQIEVKHLTTGTYFLNVFQEQKLIQSYKFIKK